MKLFHIALIFVVCLSVSSAFSYRRRRPSRPTQEDPKKLEESLWWMTKGNDNGKDNGDVGTNQRSDDDDDVDIADDSNINNNNDQDQDTDVGRNNNGRNKDQKKERQDRRNERRNDKKNARQDRRNDRQDGRQDKRNDRQNERQERRIDRKNDRQSSRNDRQNNRRDKSSGGNNRYGNGGTGGRNNNGGTNNNNGGTNNNNGNNGRTPPTDVCEEKSNEGSCGFYTHPQCFQRVLNTCRPLPVLAEKICTQSELRESEFNDEGLRYIQKVRQCTIKKLLPVVDSDDCDRVNSLVQSGLTQTPGCLFQNKDFCSVVSDPGNCEALFHIFGLGHAGELQFELFQTFNILIGQCDTETQDIFNVNFSQKFLASQTEATTTTTPPTMMMMGGNGRD